MSNPLKAIGRVFKKVVKVVKKIALPALAIGAAVLTGGAALGIMPGIAGAGGLGASLGLSSGLSAVLATAGEGALMGMATSAITGKNVLKGATSGFLIGGAAGAAGLIKPAGFATSGVDVSGVDVSAATKAANSVVDAGIQANNTAIGSQIAANAGMPAASQVITPAATAAAPGAGSTIAAAARAAPAPTLSAAPATTPAAGAVSGGQGIGSILSTPFKMLDGLDPYTRAGLIQGLGQGLMAGSQAKDQRKTEEAKAERIAANYGGGSYYSTERPTAYGPIAQRPRVVWKIDPISGEAYRDMA